MKIISIHLYPNIKYSSASIEVPGLGEINIKECISQETYDKISKEVIFVLRNKMGLKEEA